MGHNPNKTLGDNSQEKNPVITNPIWVKATPMRHKPVGLMMGKSALDDRILWMWCKKSKGHN